MSQIQLAAVMFTDLVGYSAMSGADSQRALENIRKNVELHKELISRYNGQLIKEIGDGTMAVFPTAIEAVECAVELQKSSKDFLDLPLRIGIHLGDLQMENGDAFGDGVNIASRLETLADPGGIYISEAVVQAIRGHNNISLVKLGDILLKNIDYPINIYALEGLGLPKPDLTKFPKPRRTFNKIIAISLFLLTAVVTYFLTMFDPGQPVVILMDSTYPLRVYDKETYEAGLTNADVLSDILKDLPIKTQREIISPTWHRHEEMLEFEPDLIVVHYSGFRQEDSSGERTKLKLLIRYFLDTDTKFIVYSRRTRESLQTVMDQLIEEFIEEYPDLPERVTIFPLLEYESISWKDPVVADKIKETVKEVLEL